MVCRKETAVSDFALITTERWEVYKVSTYKWFVSFTSIECLFFKFYFSCSSGSSLSSFVGIFVLSVTHVVSIRIHKYETGRFDTKSFRYKSFRYKVVSIQDVSRQTQAVKLHKNYFHFEYSMRVDKKTFWVNILRSLDQVGGTIYNSTE